MGEVVTNFQTYEQAKQNACAVLGNSFTPVRADPYKGRLGDGTDQIVGIELWDRTRKVARIRLDLDVPKGIHMNTEDWQTNTTRKTASCIQGTRNKPTAENAVLYSQYVKALYGLEGMTIWTWWKTGSKPVQ